jgi:hypothetical protein
MPTPTEYMYSHRELLALLIHHAGIEEGIWMLSVRFGFAATNAGPSDADLNPTAVASVLQIGLQKTDKLSSLAIDAAELAKQPR